ncbi:hypothetical protein [Cellulomonas rhizosphaerae]|uniref:Uncharacterized protein n=1 Tax=Cellulomonas rhizosphaerae TaxID=2293719 RepID=A0A413RLN1_9CELL|nr:hypothetical protein [Cellulomonas rhizosphaerae]RHA41003.1 hypothetical protein D1825_09190 [Cellulomonas rhizosphaerae]
MGDLLVLLSSVPLAASIVLLFNRRGGLVDWGGSAAAVRGVRIRGACFLLGLLMLGVGLTLGLQQGWTTSSAVEAGVAAAALVAFAVYRPRVVALAQTGRRQAPRIRLAPRARTVWLMLFALSALASLVLSVLAVA